MSPGWRSSEFWLTLLSVIVPGLVSTFQGSGDPRLVVAGVAVSGLYALGRSAVKVAVEVGAAKVAAQRLAFDPNKFGAMTNAEKAAVIAAASVPAPVTNPLLSSSAH